MTPEEWLRARDVLEAALELPTALRRQFVEGACAFDGGLRGRVEALLAAHERGGELLEVPAAESAFGWPGGDPGAVPVGRRIGAYRVVREIGRGGSGAVYLAERDDGHYRQHVALKVLLPGVFGPSGPHFAQERQLLAGFHHPNIARLIDGGTTAEGWPYLVMEYVEGITIDRYCEERGLPVGGRLRLFVRVCEAVQHAHRNLVLHCDIKPANVLVNTDGEPKLLDFGIAKLLAPESGTGAAAATLGTLRPLTPRYASPEQFKGEPVSTASDVYSLGVLLYELLTGLSPHRAWDDSPHTWVRAVCEGEPQKPSAAVSGGSATRRRLEGDLDDIVMMALRKEPERRYTSAEQFADDVRRHLEGLPVRARDGTWWYKAVKFVGRHRAGVAATALVAAALVAGTAATAWQAGVAQRRFDDLRKLAHSNITELHDAIAPLPGSTAARKLLVTRSLDYLNRLAAEADGDAGLQRELADAYRRVGDLQGNPYYANLGDTAGALASYRKALAIREKLAAGRTHPGPSLELAVVHARLGDVVGPAAGLAHYRRAMAIREGLATAFPTSAQIRREVMIGHSRMGDALLDAGDPAAALASYRRSLATAVHLSAVWPADARTRRSLWVAHSKIGDALAASSRPAEALEAHYRAAQLAELAVAASGTDARARRDLWVSRLAIGDALAGAGDRPGAAAALGTALTQARANAAADPADAQAKRDLGINLEHLGELWVAAGWPGVAVAPYREAVALREALARQDPANAELQHDLARAYSGFGEVHATLAAREGRAQHWRAGRAWYARALKMWLGLQRHGTLSGKDRDKPNEVRRQIVRCDLALGS